MIISMVNYVTKDKTGKLMMVNGKIVKSTVWEPTIGLMGVIIQGNIWKGRNMGRVGWSI